MRLASILALCLAGASALAVCLRMLMLARRSGELPERLMGGGLAALLFLALPLAGAGRAPGLVATPVGDALFAAGLTFLSVAIGCLSAFTWRVFRPRSMTALLCVGALTWASGVAWYGLLNASVGETMDEIAVHTRPWAMLHVALLAACFAWTAVEAGIHRVRLARRLRLGLADPIALNRMSLWLGSSAGLVVLLGAVGGAIGLGVQPLRSAPVMTAICLAAGCTGVCWLLAFFPPASYLDRIHPERPRAQGPASLSH